MLFAVKRMAHRRLMAVLKVLGKLLPIPRPVLFAGEGSAVRLCTAIAQVGARHVLLVTDAVLVSMGLHEPLVEELERHGVRTTLYDGVEPDPTYEHAEKGWELLKEQGCDAVLALGGGSPIDAAKVICALATNDVPIRKLIGILKVKRHILPLFVIPTTAGTGTEVTVAAVVSDPRSHLKTPVIDHKLVPRMAALDPLLMAGMPPAVTAATGMDALTHAVEAYLSRNATRETDDFALAAVRLTFANLARSYAEGSDLEARQAMALASYYAGLAFTKASLGYVHAIAHSFGAHYGTVHGVANAIALPHVLELSKEPARRRLAELAKAALGADLPGTDGELADRFIEEVRKLKSALDLPDTLEALRREDIPRIATEALHEAHYNYPVPLYLDRRRCERLIAAMLTA